MKRLDDKTALIALFVIAAAIYARCAFFPFSAIDDHVYVTANPRVTLGLSLDSIRWAFTTFHAANWHPLTWLSLMLDGTLSGRNPAGYHVTNLILHALDTSLLYLFLARLTGASGRSAFVAALFALHPMHVESVAWITERKDVLSTLFLFLTLLTYVSWSRERSWRTLSLSLLFFALGLMAKPMLVTVPLLLILIDLWPLGHLGLPPHGRAGGASAEAGSPVRVLAEKLPYLFLAAISSLVTVVAQKSGAAVATTTQMPLFLRLYNALWSTLQYLVKCLVPVDLAVYYPYALVPGWKAGCAAAVIAVVTVFAVIWWKRRGYFAFGWFWFLITLVPVIGLVQVGSQAMADRYTYVPYLGLFVLGVWGIHELAQRLRLPEKGVALAGLAILILFSVVTWLQLDYWSDNERLLKHTLAITEDNYFTHFALGGWYEEQGKDDLALAEFREVVRINPGAKFIHLYLGRALARRGAAGEAVSFLDEALRRDPRLASGHFYRGVSLEKLGRDAEAVTDYREASRLDPQNARYVTNLGCALARGGRLDEAIASFSKALEINPKDRKAADYLRLAVGMRGSAGAPAGREGGK